jgi:hypothetical protein
LPIGVGLAQQGTEAGVAALQITDRERHARIMPVRSGSSGQSNGVVAAGRSASVR